MSETLSGQTLRLHQWLVRISSGDDAALSELLDYFSGRLTTLARCMLAGFPQVRVREETADIVQNASLRLIRALEAVVRDRAEREAAEPYRVRDLLGLAALQIRRELLDLARHYRRQRQPRFTEGVPESDADPSAQDLFRDETWDPERISEWADFHEEASRLPDPQREVFELLWYHGLTQPEAADLLGVDVRTIKNRWQRARLSLHTALQGRIPGT